MIYCKIDAGVVVDRALFDGPMPVDWPDYDTWVANEIAQIGWSYSDGVFTAPAPPVLPPVELPPYSLSVSLLWTRMTDDEAELFDAKMVTATPLRLRKAFNSASSVKSDSELFGFVSGVMGSAIGGPRSLKVLERPNGEEMALSMEEE